jgi:hypothetical protein
LIIFSQSFKLETNLSLDEFLLSHVETLHVLHHALEVLLGQDLLAVGVPTGAARADQQGQQDDVLDMTSIYCNTAFSTL